MTDHENLLVENIKNMLDQRAHLGVPKQTDKRGGHNDPRLRGLEQLHGQIEEMFASKAAELTHFTGICAAFAKIHNYKYLDDALFLQAFDREMIWQGIPANERQKALKFVPDILRELQEDANIAADGLVEMDSPERSYGFNPNLDEIIAMCQPPQFRGQI